MDIMYFVKTPQIIRDLFPGFIWNIPAKGQKTLYLTFDDGPTPHITHWVMKQLEAHDAKATFFCVGEQILQHPHIVKRLRDAGHALGSHTFSHESGWSTDHHSYMRSARKTARLIDSDLFRPPYGRLRPSQAATLKDNFRVVMWDVMSGDFDAELTPDQCFHNVVSRAESGSIIVFHDSVKARKNLFYTLPKVLEHYSALGYRFEPLIEKKMDAHTLRTA